MKTQILKSIFLFCMLHFAFCISSNAQIVYTDIVPDTSISCPFSPSTCAHYFNLDINNDGNTDLILSIAYQNFGHCGGQWSPLKVTKVAKVYVNSGTSLANVNSNPLAIGYGGLIDSTLNWSSGLPADTLRAFKRSSCAPGTYIGNWGGADHYLPLKKTIGTNNYYGWIRMLVNVTEFGSVLLTIKEYAYNSIPNQSILAGDTGAVSTGIIHHTLTVSHFIIYPNPATNSISIKFPFHEAGEIQIVNLFGQIVFSEKTNSEEKQIDVSKFSEGMYVVKWRSGEINETKIFSVIK